MSEDVEKQRKDLEAQLNLPRTVEELRVLLEAIKKKLEKTREEAESRKEKKKRQWGRKAEGENDAQKDEKAEGECKLSSKLLASANDAEKVLQTFGDIGIKPTSTTSGNRVTSESYSLLHEILKGLGNLHYAAVGLSMVAYVLERVNLVKDNSGKCLELLQTMFNLGQDMVNAYQYLPEAGDLLRRFITEITKGVLLCGRHTHSGFFKRFSFATVSKKEFDSLSKTMTGLSEQLQSATQFAVLKGNKEMSNQLTELNKATLQVTRPTEVLFCKRGFTHIAEEAASRFGIDKFDTCHGSDHFRICKLSSEKDSSFQLLIDPISTGKLYSTCKPRAQVTDNADDACNEFVKRILREIREQGSGFVLMNLVELKFPKIRIRLEEAGLKQRSLPNKAGVQVWGQ
ncbi:unnamed protein product [Calypogeia fissa]